MQLGKRILAIMTALVIGLGLTLPSPSWADTTTASTPAGSVTFTFPDVVLDGSGECFDAPIFASATVKSNTEWYVAVTYRKPGTVPMSSTGRIRGYQSGSSEGTIQVCDFEGVGKMIVDGEVSTLEYDEPYTNSEVTFTSEVTISKTTSKSIISKVNRSSQGVTVSGKVVTQSAKYGEVTTYGDVTLTYKQPGKSKWIKMGTTSTGSTGYKLAYTKPIPKGATFKVVYGGNNFALPSTTVGK